MKKVIETQLEEGASVKYTNYKVIVEGSETKNTRTQLDAIQQKLISKADQGSSKSKRRNMFLRVNVHKLMYLGKSAKVVFFRDRT